MRVEDLSIGDWVEIDVEQYERKRFVEYTVVLNDCLLTTFYEQEIFPTKEELLKHSNVSKIGKNC